MSIRFRLNGREVAYAGPADARAVDVLREHFGLAGTKEGCGAGECGACSVLVDGTVALSCLMLAAQLEGRELVTVEGLGSEAAPHPVQQAFAEQGAVQCGYCTPGMVVAAAGLLAANPDPTLTEIKIGLSGNLCRCGGYQKIARAVAAAAEAGKRGKP